MMMRIKNLFGKSIFQLSLLQFNSLIALWLATGINLYFYQKLNSYSSLSGIAGIGFMLASAVMVFAYYFLILQFISWRITAKTVASLLVILAAFSSYFVTNLGIDIDQGQITNMMQTDAHEVLDLISSQSLLWALFTLIIPLGIIWKIKLKEQLIKQQLIAKLLGLAVALVMLLGILFVFYNQYAPIFREHRDLKSKLSPMNTISSLSGYTKRHFKTRQKALVPFGTDATLSATAKNASPKLLVLVVGETARAESFSLNGYNKDTNPELAKRDILNFSNATSCGTSTAVSVPCMFSGMQRTDYNPDLASHREGLLDIAKRAGYQVTWIDNNSGCKGACARTGSYEIPETLKQQWCKEGECYDDILLSSLSLYLKQLEASHNQQNQLIVLHQVGSHGPAYFKRYPDEFKRFNPTCDTNAIQSCSRESLINTYDNTIVYTDHILATLIDQLQQVSNFQSAMWYVSDHGESTGEHGLYLHGAPYIMAPSQQTHVPMLMWFSKAWQTQAPQLLPCLNKQLTKARGQDNLFPSILSLLDIQSKVINPSLDMTRACQG